MRVGDGGAEAGIVAVQIGLEGVEPAVLGGPVGPAGRTGPPQFASRSAPTATTSVGRAVAGARCRSRHSCPRRRSASGSPGSAPSRAGGQGRSRRNALPKAAARICPKRVSPERGWDPRRGRNWAVNSEIDSGPPAISRAEDFAQCDEGSIVTKRSARNWASTTPVSRRASPSRDRVSTGGWTANDAARHVEIDGGRVAVRAAPDLPERMTHLGEPC